MSSVARVKLDRLFRNANAPINGVENIGTSIARIIQKSHRIQREDVPKLTTILDTLVEQATPNEISILEVRRDKPNFKKSLKKQFDPVEAHYVMPTAWKSTIKNPDTGVVSSEDNLIFVNAAYQIRSDSIDIQNWFTPIAFSYHALSRMYEREVVNIIANMTDAILANYSNLHKMTIAYRLLGEHTPEQIIFPFGSHTLLAFTHNFPGDLIRKGSININLSPFGTETLSFHRSLYVDPKVSLPLLRFYRIKTAIDCYSMTSSQHDMLDELYKFIERHDEDLTYLCKWLDSFVYIHDPELMPSHELTDDFYKRADRIRQAMRRLVTSDAWLAQLNPTLQGKKIQHIM